MSDATKMPAAFIGHGSPMNTLENNRFTATWREFGQTLPRPCAVLAISAHWFIHGSAVTAMQKPRVIHDFYGFPQELFEFDYPAPGAPDVAAEIAEVVRPDFVALEQDSWGLDHGTWSVLAHMFPKADVPVVQLSVHAGEGMQYHLDLGARLAPLRERGILIIGSGNVVHNLRRIDWHFAGQAFDWAVVFVRLGRGFRQHGQTNHDDAAARADEPHAPPFLCVGGAHSGAFSAAGLFGGPVHGCRTTGGSFGGRRDHGRHHHDELCAWLCSDSKAGVGSACSSFARSIGGAATRHQYLREDATLHHYGILPAFSDEPDAI